MTATSQWYQDNFFKQQVTQTPTRDTEPLSQATLVKMFAAYRAFFNRLCLCLYLYLCSISTEQTANNFISNWVRFVVKPTWLSLWWRVVCLGGVWSVLVWVVQGREVMQWHDHTIAMQFSWVETGDIPLLVFFCCLQAWSISLWIWRHGAAVHYWPAIASLRLDPAWLHIVRVIESGRYINTAAPPPAPAARGTLQQWMCTMLSTKFRESFHNIVRRF